MNGMRKSEIRMTKLERNPKSEVGEFIPAARGRFEFRPFVIRHSSFILGFLLALSLTRSPAQSTNAPTRLDYDSFRLISDRNIFNPDRVARGSSRTTPRSSTPAAHVESFTLVGLMAYEKGVFAFFDGTSSSYKKAVEMDGEIGDFKVAEVTPEEAKLVSGTNGFTLRVGLQMRREDGGSWFVAEANQAPRNRVVVSRGRHKNAAGELVPDADASTNAESDATPEIIVVDPATLGETTDANGHAEAAPAVNGVANEGVTDPVLLRLMQRRQELNNR